MHNPRILITATEYFSKLLYYHGITYNPFWQKNFLSIVGFDEYNFLYTINSIFSTAPKGDFIDRSSTIRMPFNMSIGRPWIKFDSINYTLEETFLQQVKKLESKSIPINILWSGGIDSTAVVVAFLKHSSNLKNVRILYSTASMKENPGFFLKLLEHNDIELVEFSGDFYLNQQLDGIFVTGDLADDLTASLDQSFFDAVGFAKLNSSWKDYFWDKVPDVNFINFCEKYFQASGRPIETLLEARWWFYTNTKSNNFPALASRLLNFDQPLVVGFFDNYYFENYMCFNLDKILPNDSYNSYKLFLKEYIYEYDKDDQYLKNKIKTNSVQSSLYAYKKMFLNDQRYILLLDNGERIRTDNLPFLSERDYRQKYNDSLNYLFNT